MELVTAVSGELQSFAGLSKKIKDVDRALRDRLHAVEREQTYYRVIGAIALALAIGVAGAWLKDITSAKSVQAVPGAARPASGTP